MSLRVVPPKAHAKQTTPVVSAPSAPGLHDTLRASIQPLPTSSSSSSSTTSTSTSTSTTSTHPLEARLSAWRNTQDAMRMDMLRRTYGIAEPVRRGMELKIVKEGEWRPACLGGASSVHSDILSGRDMEIGWEDVFGAGAEFKEMPGFHAEMEHKLRMN